MFLLELGHGFAFAGRPYHVEIDGDDFSSDLLLCNGAQSRFVVIELEIDRFRPEHTGQLGFSVATRGSGRVATPPPGCRSGGA